MAVAVFFDAAAFLVVIVVGLDQRIEGAEQERAGTHGGVEHFDFAQFADFGNRALEVFVAEQGFGFGEDGFDFFAQRVADDVVRDVLRRVVDAFLFAQFVGVLDDDAPAILEKFVGKETLIDRAHHVLRHEAEVVP